MPNSTPIVVVRELTSRGYNADRDAVTLLADEPDPERAVEHVVEHAPADVLTISAAQVREALDARGDDAERDGRPGPAADAATEQTEGAVEATEPDATAATDTTAAGPSAGDRASTAVSQKTHTSASTARENHDSTSESSGFAPETKGVGDGGASGVEDALNADDIEAFERAVDETLHDVSIANDITGQSTGTGDYDDFVSVFRDRYDRLSSKLRGRVNHRPTNALESMGGGSDAAIVGMVNDIRSTASGHWLIELEDTNGVFPALVMKDRDIAAHVDELLLDEVIAVEGSLAQDGGILFVDSMHFPDIPRTYEPNTADRHVQAALISDVHVGSQEFADYAWESFARWLHTEEAEHVEYLLLAGDMVEGVGVYPDQDEELDIVDIYEQYEAFAEKLKQVPGDMEIVMIPGNHDAVRLAEPQPAFDEELRDIMSAHDARITGNPSVVTVEGVDVLMYHGVSIDEVIAEHPSESVSYEAPHRAMAQLLKKRHVAPQYGDRLRVAPEEKDYLVIDDVPDVFHTGHVHKLGVGTYNNVRLVNSGCWQEQTAFQKSVNIDPDVATAPILDLDTLDVTVRKFEN
ncbi:DNA-directed DNA polymerase II small subunit [Salarchaeum sp. JOR-1]|uniref:DNA-directed DNA polymerase II small subunit n=1 Tax=Salarchaeum sp. JOR-1 TaxID=2599399 RepID=UPI00119830A7|nr:DNA-directed DNA polymerase II small subunit [Salarchaeum sp. JOR-1]QDX40211.1 DNA-directed DNA polymerase II small subunit [Salarchaeum sp. JOR-1]